MLWCPLLGSELLVVTRSCPVQQRQPRRQRQTPRPRAPAGRERRYCVSHQLLSELSRLAYPFDRLTHLHPRRPRRSLRKRTVGRPRRWRLCRRLWVQGQPSVTLAALEMVASSVMERQGRLGPDHGLTVPPLPSLIVHQSGVSLHCHRHHRLCHRIVTSNNGNSSLRLAMPLSRRRHPDQRLVMAHSLRVLMHFRRQLTSPLCHTRSCRSVAERIKTASCRRM
jgi:hypothetical protein